MSSSTFESKLYPPLDLQKTLTSNRLVGLWRLIHGFRAIYIAAIISLAIAAAAKTMTYMLLRYFVDEVIVQPEPPLAYYWFALAFIGLAMFEGGFTFLSGRFAARSTEGAILRLRNALFDHLQRLPIAYYGQTKTGDLIQRCSSDVDALRLFLSAEAIGIGRLLILFGVNFVTLLYLNVQLALLTVIFLPFIVALSLYFFRHVNVSYEAYQEQEGQLSARLQESLSGTRVVKAFARQEFEMDKFERDNWGQYQKGLKLIRLEALFWPLSEGLSLLQWLIVMIVGALMVLDGTMTIGTYIAFIGLSIWLIFPMQNVGRLIIQLSEGLVSYQRLTTIFKQTVEDESPLEPPDAGGSYPLATLNPNGKPPTNGQHHNGYAPNGTAKLAPARQGEVIFDKVSLQYDGGAPVLQDISFVIQPGETVALLGPTGAGKSSLVNLLPRFHDYTGGRIWLDGQPLRSFSLPQLRHRIGIVQQEPFLFSRTIRENIAYGVQGAASDEQIHAAARAAAVHEVILSFPDGYNTLVGEKGVTLSGGQKQRIAIARTLLKDPHLLIFDDAVSAVDTETEGVIQAALERLRQGRSTIIIAHRIQTVMRADRIVVLDKGRIVQQGTHATLVNQPGLYQEIYRLQAELEYGG